MQRRKFMLGVGSAAIGGSALIGSGAFTRVESQRDVSIEIARDPDAYVGLDGCEGSDNSSYTNIDTDGHLEIDMSSDNPTDGGGEGVNSDSFSYFDDVFQICNQGKADSADFWLEVPEVNTVYYDSTEYPVVSFYTIDSEGKRTYLDGDSRVTIDLGECECIGIRTVTKTLGVEDSPLLDDEVVVHAEAN